MIVPLEKPASPKELVHHGIKGQRWGFRKKEETSNRKSAQPKPLSDKKEKRAKGHEANAKQAQARIDVIKSKPSTNRFIQAHRNDQIKVLEKQRNTEAKAAKDIREGHMTDHQKKVLIGAGVTVGILAAYGSYKLWDTGVGHQLINNPKDYKESIMLSRKGMSSDQIMKDVVKPINPGYGGFGTKMNCRRCTFAYEMRRRGYDVRATNSASGFGQNVAGLINVTDPRSHLPTSESGIERQLEAERFAMGPLRAALEKSAYGKEKIGAKYLGNFGVLAPKAKTAVIYDAIAAHGTGARGELGVRWKMGGAHSLAWENIDGIPHVFDTQTGTHYDFGKFADTFGDVVQEAGLTRLDNETLNGDFIGRWIRNAK